MISNGKKRIQWLDFAKGIAILSVLMIHAVSYDLNEFISFLNYILPIFAMPIFFAISGYLYKPTNTGPKFKLLMYKKITSFIIPYIAFTYITIAFKSIHGAKYKHIFSYLISESYHLILPIDYMWFLYALFFIFIIVGILDLMHINLYIQLFISIIFMFGQMFVSWHINSNGNINPVAGIGGYMICFYMGYVIKKFNIIKILKKKSIVISLFVLWMILIFIQIHFTGMGNYYDTDLFNYSDFITKLLSIPVFFLLFDSCNHNKTFRYFDKYGKYTLIIYLVHAPILTVINNHILDIYNLTSRESILGFIICITVTWYLSLLVCWLAKRCSLIEFIFYPRKYINKLLLK